MHTPFASFMKVVTCYQFQQEVKNDVDFQTWMNECLFHPSIHMVISSFELEHEVVTCYQFQQEVKNDVDFKHQNMDECLFSIHPSIWLFPPLNLSKHLIWRAK
jgi:hypothetical protein